FVSSPTGGPVAGTNAVLQSLEPSFPQDLNSDGTIGTPVSGGVGGHAAILSSFKPPLSISPSDNTAFASSGLSAPSLSFIGTPNAATLGPDPTTVLYTLNPASGIETVANFNFGTDDLAIDLAGAEYSVLQAFDTTVGGVRAVAFASSADLSHGIVLLNVPIGLTAADLLASHTTFSGGQVLIG
ncbi:MAG: hypothetical protein WCI94_05855, partial [Rhodospirillales bacterium]